MDELLRMLFDSVTSDIMGGVNKDNPKKDDDTMKEQVEADIKDFKSLVSEEELEAIKKVKKALEELVDVHNKHVVSNLIKDVRKATPQQKVHYMVFCDVVKDTMRDVQCLSTVNTEGVKALAEIRADMDTTYEKMEKAKMFGSLLNL